MRERGRGSGLPISDDACRSILGGSSRSLVALPGLTLPRLAHRQHPHADSRGQPAPCSDNLDEVRRHSVGFHVGALLDPRFFSGETRFLRILSPLEPLAFSTRGKQLWGIIEERVQTMARITTGRLNVQYVWSPVESPTKPSAVAPLNSAVPSTASAVYRWACWNLGHGDDVKRFPWASPPQRGKHSARFRPLTGSPDPT